MDPLWSPQSHTIVRVRARQLKRARTRAKRLPQSSRDTETEHKITPLPRCPSHHRTSLKGMRQDIRIAGDPVLRQRADEINDIDESLVKLATAMGHTMRQAHGLGLAAPQVGISKRLFVWGIGPHDPLRTIINPQITESDGEWLFSEGCLSIPGLYWDIWRPKQVLVEGIDLNGNRIAFEADEIVARLFLHEIDHLDGTLMVDRLDADERAAAERRMESLGMGTAQ